MRVHYQRRERSATTRFAGLAFSRRNGEYFLLGFDINQARLKPQHESFLDELVSTHDLATSSPRGQIELIEGYTDEVRGPNDRLRRLRASAVAQGLLTRQVAPHLIGVVRPAHEGAFLADNNTPEGRTANRAALLRLTPIGGRTLPPVIVPPAPAPIVSQNFSIRMRLGVSGGHFGVGVDAVYFDILDETNSYVTNYRYVGGSISVGTPVSGTPRGPWNHFFVPRPLSSGQFTGRGMMGSIGGLQWTSSYLMVPTPEGMPNVYLAPFNTAPTLGVGISPIGSGRFTVVGPPHPRRADEW
jgi:hypothetical protein